MGFGPFSSESRSSVSTVSTAFNTGFSDIAGPASSVNLNIASGKKSKAPISAVVNLTDQGALKAASDIATRSLDEVQSFAARLEAALTSALAAVSAQSGTAIEAVSSANRSETENLGLAAIKWGTLALGGFFLMRALTGAKS